MSVEVFVLRVDQLKRFPLLPIHDISDKDIEILSTLKLQWCRARDLIGLQIPMTTERFELRIFYIRGNYLSQ